MGLYTIIKNPIFLILNYSHLKHMPYKSLMAFIRDCNKNNIIVSRAPYKNHYRRDFPRTYLTSIKIETAV